MSRLLGPIALLNRQSHIAREVLTVPGCAIGDMLMLATFIGDVESAGLIGRRSVRSGMPGISYTLIHRLMAVASGNVQMFQLTTNRYAMLLLNDLAPVAARFGRRDMLSYLLSEATHGPDWLDATCEAAVIGGHTEMLRECLRVHAELCALTGCRQSVHELID
jgi:hypothetical protein